jgi:hypothetical protein
MHPDAQDPGAHSQQRAPDGEHCGSSNEIHHVHGRIVLDQKGPPKSIPTEHGKRHDN